MKVLSGFMVVTPLAVFALMANTAASYQGTLFMGLRYILSAYISGLLVLIVIMILPVTLFCGISPLEYIRKVYKIWLLTISTCSSAATLPHTLRLCKEDLGLDERLCDSVIPLGCTIHMCGGAVSFSLLGIFCAKLYGVEVTFSLYLMMVLSSLILNMSAPGIPNGGVVIGATYLEMLGIPLGFIGFYSGIYKILDMLYTSLNVTGDISAALLLSGRRK
jgi:Na+/H+-dicarboxylate symporter